MDQDWDTVVFNKKKTTEQARRDGETHAVRRMKGDRPSSNFANDFDPETAATPTISNLSLSSAMQKARSAKGLTQAQLNQECNLPKNTIRDYESGKAVYNAAQVNRIARHLGVTLPRPRKTKVTK